MTFSINDLQKLTSLDYIENNIVVKVRKKGLDFVEINVFPCTCSKDAGISDAYTAINGDINWYNQKIKENNGSPKYEIVVDNFNKKLNTSKKKNE